MHFKIEAFSKTQNIRNVLDSQVLYQELFRFTSFCYCFI
jgi:hypothetical protein